MVKNTVVKNQSVLLSFLGQKDENLRIIRRHLKTKITIRGNEIRLTGEPAAVESDSRLVDSLLETIASGRELTHRDISYVIENAASPTPLPPKEIFGSDVRLPKGRKTIHSKSKNQAAYLKAIMGHDITIGIGPAGTGKTFLAVALALDALLHGKVKKLILTRPVVEAGENLGFLPGTLEEKIHPYLRPLYDAILEMVEYEKFEQLSRTGAIEIAPLAYMRGRTLTNAFVILDEAQNTTSKQMQLFLTRLGDGSKMVITGDVSQIDLPHHQRSGLVEIVSILRGIPEIKFIHFEEADVMRHPLIRRIIAAYESAQHSHSDGKR